jgi:hypothetical protein
VAKEIILISVDIQGYWERVNFDIIKISTYDAVLRLLWLEKHNLIINYKDRIMVFNDCGCKLTKNINIKKISVRAINAYFKQNSD